MSTKKGYFVDWDGNILDIESLGFGMKAVKNDKFVSIVNEDGEEIYVATLFDSKQEILDILSQ